MLRKAAWITGVLALTAALFWLWLPSGPAGPAAAAPVPTPAPSRPATAEELARARAEWAASKHAETWDEGLGGNTTCARCKSPANWDPTQDLAAQESLNCSSCKRVPGAARPELASGVPVDPDDWQNITCTICHPPAGGSVSTGIAYWNQASGQYEAVRSTDELCARCHEGRHGFEVSEEQRVSAAHQGWECTRCHGPHGQPSACTDCHDPTQGAGAAEHARHTKVNCTACHDAGSLAVWLDPDPQSSHYQTYITQRFAHTITSWPSHDLQRPVACARCHHPRGKQLPALVSSTGCDNAACHPNGASLSWCPTILRSPLIESQP